jgi:acyl carrier protein
LTDQDIYDGLTEILRQTFDDDTIVARPDMTAADIPDWDSFTHINIIVATELKFGVSFGTGEIEALKNVGELARLVKVKTS